MALNFTTSPQVAVPAAAQGLALTPSGSSWGNSAWVEVSPLLSVAWTLGHLTYMAGVSCEFEIDVGVGPGGSEVVVGTLAGQTGSISFTGYNVLKFPVALGPIAAGSRVALRLRKSGTDTTAWALALGLWQGTPGGNLSRSAVAPKVLPTGAGGVSVTPNGTTWANSAYTTLVASTSGVLTAAALIVVPGTEIESAYEVDLAVGAGGSEVVVTTLRGDTEDDFWGMGPGVLPLQPLLANIGAGVRVAVRMRKKGTSTAAWTFKLLHYVAFDRPELVTAKAQSPRPSAADSLSLTSGASAGTPGAWVQFDAALGSTYAVVAIVPAFASPYQIDVDVGYGPGGSEVVATTFRASGEAGNSAAVVPLQYACDIPSGARLVARAVPLDLASISRAFDVAIVGILAPDFTQVTTQPQQVWPDRADGAVNTMVPSSWANSPYVAFVADSGGTAAVITGMAIYAGFGDESEIDIAFGAPGAEVVATTFRIAGQGNATSHHPNIPLDAPLFVPPNTRVSYRTRRNNNALTQAWTIALTHTPTTTVPPATLTKESEWKDTETLLAWVEFNGLTETGTPKTFYWAGVAIALGASPYKEPRVLQFGAYERRLSDRMGRLESATCSFELSDVDSLLRGFMANPFQLAMQNVEVLIKLCTRTDYEAGRAPLTYFRGVVRAYQALQGFRFKFDCWDWLSARIEQPMPLSLVGPAFPGALVAARTRVGPVWYGRLSDEPSATAAPTLVADDAAHLMTDLGTGQGVGHMPGIPPTGLATAAVAASGTFLTTDTTLRVGVSAVYSGVESDMQEFLPASCPIQAIASNGSAIRATCANNGVANAYRFYLAVDYFGVRWTQYIETTDPVTGVLFTDSPGAGGQSISGTTITAGAHYAAAALRWVVVTAVMADGETVPTTPRFVMISRGYLRPARVAWTPVVGATSYNVYGSEGPTTAPFGRKWSVATTQLNGDGNVYFVDDWHDTGVTYITDIPAQKGVVPGFDVGFLPDLFGYNGRIGVAFAAHALKEYESLYIEKAGVVTKVDPSRYGLDVYVPGHTGFSTTYGPPYYDAPDGTRWSLIYILGPDADDIASGAAVIRANIKGVEATGDATGALVANYADQHGHLNDNYLLTDDPYAGGLWHAPPTWADSTPRRDLASYETLKAAAVAAGLNYATRGWGVAQATQILAVEAQLAVSGDFSYGWTRQGQLRVVLQPPDSTATTIVDSFTEIAEIFTETFSLEDLTDPSWFFNQLGYSYAPRWSATDGSVTYSQVVDKDDAPLSQLQFHRVIRASEQFQFLAAQLGGDAAVLAARIMQRGQQPTRQVSFGVGLYAFATTELGDMVSVTHREGTGPTGYNQAPMQVRSIAPNIGQASVSMMLWDVSVLQSSSAAATEEAMADKQLGGSRENDYGNQADGTYNIPEWRPVRLDWNLVPASWLVRARVWCQNDSGASQTPSIAELNDVAVATGSSDANTTFTEQVIPITRPGNVVKYYKVRSAIAGAAAKKVYTFGWIETVPS